MGTAVLALLELGEVDTATKPSSPLKRLAQQAIDNDEMPYRSGSDAADWPGIAVNGSVFCQEQPAFESQHMHRTLGAKVAWPRISTFIYVCCWSLALKKECQREEWICQLPPNTLLPLLLISFESVFSDWLVADGISYRYSFFIEDVHRLPNNLMRSL